MPKFALNAQLSLHISACLKFMLLAQPKVLISVGVSASLKPLDSAMFVQSGMHTQN
jgi:hypothetical protein